VARYLDRIGRDVHHSLPECDSLLPLPRASQSCLSLAPSAFLLPIQPLLDAARLSADANETALVRVGFGLREVVRRSSSTSTISAWDLDGNEIFAWAIMLLWARLLPLLSMHKRMGPLLQMVIQILTRDVVDWLGVMVMIMFSFVASMWFLFGGKGMQTNSTFDVKYRDWYTSAQALFAVVLESTQLDQTLLADNVHPQIGWYGTSHLRLRHEPFRLP